jgi:hypothetical protein
MKKLVVIGLTVCFMIIAQLPTFAGRVGPSYGGGPCECTEPSQIPCYDEQTGLECNQYLREGSSASEAFSPIYKEIETFTEPHFSGKGKVGASFDARIVDESFSLTRFSIIDTVRQLFFFRMF